MPRGSLNNEVFALHTHTPAVGIIMSCYVVVPLQRFNVRPDVESLFGTYVACFAVGVLEAINWAFSHYSRPNLTLLPKDKARIDDFNLGAYVDFEAHRMVSNIFKLHFKDLPKGLLAAIPSQLFSTVSPKTQVLSTYRQHWEPVSQVGLGFRV